MAWNCRKGVTGCDMYRIGGKRVGANWKSKAGEDGTVGDRIGTAWSVEAGDARWGGEWNVAECCGAWRQARRGRWGLDRIGKARTGRLGPLCLGGAGRGKAGEER